jgi:Mg2+-importing ATPase
MITIKKDDIDVSQVYGEDCVLSINDFMKKHNVQNSGLSTKQVEENIKNFGINQIKQAKPKRWYNYFFSSLFTPFNMILLGICFILLYTDIILPEVPSPANIIVILSLIVISTLLEFIEVYRSNKAAEKLKNLVSTTVTVIRNNKESEISVTDLTVDDLVVLSAGDMIPADLRIIESKDLYVGQSSITGESDSVKKLSQTEIESIKDIESITDVDTICFMGTNVISGSAKGIVTRVGDSTYFGKVAKTLSQGKPKTNFQKSIENISKLLIRFMFVLIPIVFIVNFSKHSPVTAFTFAVAIAITITPLLLPVILSSCLSKGAIRMSKKKTIVKKLDSIQNFGAMNILCTDKTGTLTEDKIVLEKYLDVDGNEDIRVLKHAFLNSYFQTGLKGSIDEAVINRALKNNLAPLVDEFKKIDEIPFDFSRRRLSVIVEDKNQKYLITKGAVEEILSICTTIDRNHNISPLTKEIKDNIRSIANSLNEDGLRVVAVCQRKDIDKTDDFCVEDEKNMSLVGFIGFLDPPKESAKLAVEKLNNAGIRVIVLTGDNAAVTKCICKKVNINTKKIITGAQIDKLPDSGVVRLVKKCNIFVKLSPIQKARIVRLLKEAGNVVGYMGDGINDAPSLTNSDVGVSVDSAVDIAKETADIILLEKDLKVLLDGVIERKTYFWKFNEIY